MAVSTRFTPGDPLGKQALVRRPAELKNVLSWTVEPRGVRAPITSTAYRPDNQQIATASRDGSVRIWDAASGQLVRMLITPDEIDRIAWSKDGNTLATALDSRILFWNVQTGRLLRTITWKSGRVLALAWSSDLRLIASATDRSVTVWDWTSGKPSVVMPTASRVNVLAWHPHGQQIATAGEKNDVTLYEVDSSRQLRTWTNHTQPARSLAWSADGKALVSVGYDQAFVIYDPTAQDSDRTISTQPIAAAEFWPDEDHVLPRVTRV